MKLKFKLPDRHDLLVLGGFGLVVAGVAQVSTWVAFVIGGIGLIYVGAFTERE